MAVPLIIGRRTLDSRSWSNSLMGLLSLAVTVATYIGWLQVIDGESTRITSPEPVDGATTAAATTSDGTETDFSGTAKNDRISITLDLNQRGPMVSVATIALTLLL